MRVLIALPVLNEETLLRETVGTLRAFCGERLRAHEVTFVIADNGSTDGTEAITRELVAAHADVRSLRLTEKGKGRAIRAAWSSQEADVYTFMDADLSTDISALPDLVARIADGADVAAGSRYHAASVVERGLARKVFSRGYRALLLAAFGTRIEDAPCGFKAVSARVIREILPQTEDQEWFFDTEMILRAERAGMRIEAVPVQWSDISAPGRRSKVRVFSLAAAYSRRVFSLRKSMGPVSLTKFPGIRASVASIAPWERRGAIWATMAAVTLVAAPAIFAFVHAATWDLTWTGRSVFAPGDTSVYLNQIAQAREGVFFFVDQATSEPVAPLANPFWFAVGLLCRVTGMSTVAAYTATRLLLVPVFALVAYAALAVFVRRPAVRIAAFLTLFFAGGVGLFVEPFLRNAGALGVSWPIDLWVAEALPFLSMLYSPHFIASWTLLLAAVTGTFATFRSGAIRHALFAGGALFLLASFHPFYVPTVAFVTLTFLVWDTFTLGFRGRSWALLFLVFAVASPAIAYHAWAFLATGNNALYGAQNVLVTPSLPYVVAGFGVPFVAAAWAFGQAVVDRKKLTDEERFLFTWLGGSLFLAYSPLSFQRRLLEGTFFPMAALAAPVLVAAWTKVSRTRFASLALPALFTLLIVATTSSAGGALLRTFDAYATSDAVFYEYEDEAAAYAWLRSETSRDARSLASFSSSHTILGLGERPVYAGHWAMTIDPARKAALTERYYAAMTDEERGIFLRTNGITYVWYGHDERAMWPSFVPDSSLEEAFVFGNVTVYRFQK